MEPEQMIDKYISLQTRLYRLDPASVVQAQGKGGKRLAGTLGSTQSKISPSHQIIGRIQAQIKQIAADILFDKEQADLLWASQHVQLCQDAASRRRLDIIDSGENESRKIAPLAPSKISEVEEPDMILGELFENLPNVSIPSIANNNANMSTTGNGGTSIHIRTFKKWSGLEPRRVFEEACRARQVLTALCE